MIKNRGFTLIELLVVIAIIGILSSVVLVNLNTARMKGRDVKRIADIGQIKLALEMYYDQNSAYPAKLSDLVTAGFLGSLPKDPSGSDYSYAGLGNGDVCLEYHLGAQLEDTNNQALSSDSDYDSSSATVCTGSNEGFNGNPSPDNVYDFKR